MKRIISILMLLMFCVSPVFADYYVYQDVENETASCIGGCDQNWSTADAGTVQYMNWTIPANASRLYSTFDSKEDSGTPTITNYTLPLECWDVDGKVVIYWYSSFSGDYCWNKTASDWSYLGGAGGNYYEGAMNWYIEAPATCDYVYAEDGVESNVTIGHPSVTNPEYAYDGNYSTRVGNDGLEDWNYLYVNYTIPSGTVDEDYTQWQVKLGSDTVNYTIPSSCFDEEKLQMQIEFHSGEGRDSNGYCYNGTAWTSVYDRVVETANVGLLYEEGMYWCGEFVEDEQQQLVGIGATLEDVGSGTGALLSGIASAIPNIVLTFAIVTFVTTFVVGIAIVIKGVLI